MPTRSIQIVVDGDNIHMWYGKRDPSVGTYFNSSAITAATVAVYDLDGTELFPATAMTYVANLGGYVLNWSPGTALNGLNVIYVKVTPTTTQPRALVPDEITQIDLAHTVFTASVIENAVWNAARINHVDEGTYGQGVSSVRGDVTGTVANLTTYIGNTPQTGDAFARLGAPAGASTAADIAAIKTDTGTLTTRLTEGRASNLGNLDVQVSTRMAASSYTAPDNTSITAIKAKTDQFVFTVANQVDALVKTINPGPVSDIQAGLAVPGSAMTLTSAERTTLIKLWYTIDWTTITGESSRSGLNALRLNRNRRNISGDTLYVYGEDDTTVAWQAALTFAGDGNPTNVDPT